MKWIDKLRRAVKSSAAACPPPDVENPSPADNAAPLPQIQNEPASVSPDTLAVSKLSPRETQIFQRLLNGSKLKDIAAELGLQPSTVGGYSREVYRQLGVNSKAQLILRYGVFRDVNAK